jgi:membrane protease YdiL (CAAX protease family)
MMEKELDGTTLFRRPAILLLGRGLAFYGLVVITALLFNRVSNQMVVVFLLTCLALPLLGGRPEGLRWALVLRRQGWPIVAVLTLLELLVPYGGLLAVIKGYLGAMFLHPTLTETFRFLAGQMLLLVSLALAEEFFFRGYLQETVFSTLWGERGQGPLSLKNLAASILFGLAHGVSRLSPFGLLTMFSGLVLGWLMERSGGSIWPVVVLHAVSNLASAWFTLLIGLNSPWW